MATQHHFNSNRTKTSSLYFVVASNFKVIKLSKKCTLEWIHAPTVWENSLCGSTPAGYFLYVYQVNDELPCQSVLSISRR